MDQIKIGEFISSKRKEKNITQSKLAEMLGITDRAISKWENGICLPDASNIVELCKILDITINDLFSGEVVDMRENEKKLEENLLEMVKLKEQKDKQLLNLEIVIGFISSIAFITLIFVASFLELDTWLTVLLVVIGSVIFAFGLGQCLRIEQTAGYYECPDCHYKYVPTYKTILFAKHINRTRKMTCPNCGKKNWQKKVISK